MRLILTPYQKTLAKVELKEIVLENLIVTDLSAGAQRISTPHMTFHGTFFETAVAPSAKLVSLSGSYPIGSNLSALKQLTNLLFEPGLRNLLRYYKVVLERPGGVIESGVIRSVSVSWSAENSQVVNTSIAAVVDADSLIIKKVTEGNSTDSGMRIFETFRMKAGDECRLVVGNVASRFYISGVDYSITLNVFTIGTNWRTYIHTFNVEPLIMRIVGYMFQNDALAIEKLFTVNRERNFSVEIPPLVLRARYLSYSQSTSGTLPKMSAVSVEGYLSHFEFRSQQK